MQAQIAELVARHREIEKTYRDYQLRITPDVLALTSTGNLTLGGLPLTEYAERQLVANWLNLSWVDWQSHATPTKGVLLSERLTGYNDGMGGILRPVRDMVLVRQQGDTVRGVLGHRYHIINHTMVLDKVGGALQRANIDAQVVLKAHTTNNGDHMHVRIVTGADGALRSGVAVGNGEVGDSAVYIIPFLYRQVCTNGLMVKIHEQQFRVVHRGHGEYAMDQAIKDALTQSASYLDQFKLTMQFRVVDHGKEIAARSKQLGFTKAFAERVEQAWRVEPDPTGFGIINAFTRAAQGVGDLSDRINVEAKAATLIKVYAHGN